MWFEIVTWTIALVSIVAVLANIQKKAFSYLLFTGVNFAWMVVDLHKEILAQAVLFFIYSVLSVYGYCKWKKEERLKP